MKIGFDARLIHETGIGRYIENLLQNLAKSDHENDYVIYLPAISNVSTDYFPKSWKIVRTPVRWHTFREQLAMPIRYYLDKLDLLHVPYHNIPVLYVKPYVVTIHDLIVLHFDTGKATTLPYTLYKLRRLGYRIALTIGLMMAKRIITVSETTKKEITDHFKISGDKIDVIYEGIDSRVLTPVNSHPLVTGDYFLYVGNAYPHKNLSRLTEAFGQFLYSLEHQMHVRSLPKLVFVGKRNFFSNRLEKEAEALMYHKQMVFYGEAENGDLGNLFRFARALIMPSLMEGFGLPPLEALANGTPVIVSDIPVFHEILGNTPLYFNPLKSNELVKKMIYIWENEKSFKKTLPSVGSLLARFRWIAAAEDTIRCYTKSLKE